jgi:lysophospholipase L1-like esterase
MRFIKRIPKNMNVRKRIRISDLLGWGFLIYSSVTPLKYVTAQEFDYFLDHTRYSFIHYDENYFSVPDSNTNFICFFNKVDSLIRFGDRKMNILHLGGSHIQADMYTDEMRTRLNQLGTDMNGGRGLIFPVKMVHSNNPISFSVKYTGNWDYCKCTRLKDSCNIGLTGFSVTTKDSLCSIWIDPNCKNNVYYTFNRIRIFHEPTNYRLYISTKDSLYYGIYNERYGYTLFNLKKDESLFQLEIVKDTCNDSFSLLGISLETDSPGITYNSVGVNGAMLRSYLNCKLLSKHMEAIAPDLLVFSIGTNEGNTKHFDSLSYITEYRQLLELSKLAAPQSAILLTVPNDCYLYKRYTNTNTSIMREIIYNLAKEYHCGIWDFYNIMGGLDSSQDWYAAGLMKSDKIHFNEKGYLLKGDLFFSAFLKSWESQFNHNVNPSHENRDNFINIGASLP